MEELAESVYSFEELIELFRKRRLEEEGLLERRDGQETSATERKPTMTCSLRNSILAFLAVAFSISANIGCTPAEKADMFPSKTYLIGIQNGLFVFRHDHKTYKASCTRQIIAGHNEDEPTCTEMLYYLNGEPIRNASFFGESINITEGIPAKDSVIDPKCMYFTFEAKTIE